MAQTDSLQRVLINRIGVIHVELRLRDDGAELTSRRHLEWRGRQRGVATSR